MIRDGLQFFEWTKFVVKIKWVLFRKKKKRWMKERKMLFLTFLLKTKSFYWKKLFFLLDEPFYLTNYFSEWSFGEKTNELNRKWTITLRTNNDWCTNEMKKCQNVPISTLDVLYLLTNLNIYILCLSVCIYWYPIILKTANLIGPIFFCGNSYDPMQKRL